MQNWSKPYLLDWELRLLVDVLVADPLLFLIPNEEDDFLFLFWCVALATVSLCGNIMPDAGVATTRLVSVLQLAAFFCLFFGMYLIYRHNLNGCRCI